MAHGRRRIWAGAGLVGLGVLAGAAVIASRWYGFAYEYPAYNPASDCVIGLTHGRLGWSSFLRQGSTPAAVGQFLVYEPPPRGPVLLLRDVRKIFQLSHNQGFQWLRLCCYISNSQVPYKSFEMVAWPIPVLLLGVGVVPLWSGGRQRRRWGRGQCLRCGYDLSGTPAPTPCPECGGVRGAKAE